MSAEEKDRVAERDGKWDREKGNVERLFYISDKLKSCSSI